MLILTRKIDQSIVISGNITVMVLGVERDRVKLGIAAPADITVLREELCDGNRDENAPRLLRPQAVRPAPPVEGNLALKPRPRQS